MLKINLSKISPTNPPAILFITNLNYPKSTPVNTTDVTVLPPQSGPSEAQVKTQVHSPPKKSLSYVSQEILSGQCVHHHQISMAPFQNEDQKAVKPIIPAGDLQRPNGAEKVPMKAAEASVPAELQ